MLFSAAAFGTSGALAKGLLAPDGLPERDALIRLHRSDGHHE